MANFDLHHVHHFTADVQKTAEWYINSLGAKETGRKGDSRIDVDIHGVRVRITTLHPDSPVKVKQSYGLDHVAFDTDDYAGVLQQLKARGNRILDERDVDGKVQSYVEGPDGVKFVLLQGHGQGHKY